MPPCCLTPFGSPLTIDRNGHLQQLVHRDAVEVGVQHLVRDRIELVVLDQDAGVAGAGELQRDQRVRARLRVQDLQQRLGLHRNRRVAALAVAAVEHAGHLAAAARAPRLVLAERVARLCFEYRFHVFLMLSLG